VALAAGCQDHTKPGPSGEEPSQVSAQYICGNAFDVHNQDPGPITVQYEVTGASEQGELLLPPRVDPSTASATRLITLQAGPLVVVYDGDRLAPVGNLGTACPPPSPTSKPRVILGEWDLPFDWPVVAVHLHLLSDGKVLSWGRIGDPYLWNPETGAFTTVPGSTMLFCSGHTFLGDGRLLVAGGHIDDGRGLPDANIFEGAGAWTAVQPMSRGRWYPTTTTLANGEVVTLAGTDENGTVVETPELWTGSSWRALPGASRALPYYPRTFVAPNGLVFYAGELQLTAYLDPTGLGEWVPLASSNYGRRDYGSAVMYRPGKVMIVGGSDPPDGVPTNTAELIDLDYPLPSWRFTDPMTYPRRQFNATLLPDGRVLVTGGTSAAGFSNPAGAVHAAEMWDPYTERWTVLASNRVTRVYHSTTLLLPDGRILHTGSGDGPGVPRELSAEIYSPPYLFRGARPSITDTPDAIGYGQEFFLATPEPGQVVRATMLRLPSVTHGFDQSQRFLELPIRRTAGGLSLTAPASGALAPPGPYLIFVLNAAGVPSPARTIRIE
jgi:hypothetical protein